MALVGSCRIVAVDPSTLARRELARFALRDDGTVDATWSDEDFRESFVIPAKVDGAWRALTPADGERFYGMLPMGIGGTATLAIEDVPVDAPPAQRADFDEGQHPRDGTGKFVTGEGAGVHPEHDEKLERALHAHIAAAAQAAGGSAVDTQTHMNLRVAATKHPDLALAAQAVKNAMAVHGESNPHLATILRHVEKAARDANGGSAAPSAGWSQAKTNPIPQQPAVNKETGALVVDKNGKQVMTGAAPGLQLEPHVMARLKEIGARLPPAHIGDVQLGEHLFHPTKVHEGAVVKWQTTTASGKKMTVVGVSAKQQEESHERIFARTESQRPKMAALQRELEQKAATSPPHAAAALIAETGLRRGSDDNEPGHYGVLTMEARHVTFSDGKAHIEYVGKEGVTNRATVDRPEIVHALQALHNGKAPTDPLWPKGTTEAAVQKTLLKGQKIKDLRTIVGTRTAEQALGERVPSLTGDPKRDKREVARVIKDASGVVAAKLNNKPAQALKSYIAPAVIRAWGEKHGVNKEWLK